MSREPWESESVSRGSQSPVQNAKYYSITSKISFRMWFVKQSNYGSSINYHLLVQSQRFKWIWFLIANKVHITFFCWFFFYFGVFVCLLLLSYLFVHFMYLLLLFCHKYSLLNEFLLCWMFNFTMVSFIVEKYM